MSKLQSDIARLTLPQLGATAKYIILCFQEIKKHQDLVSEKVFRSVFAAGRLQAWKKVVVPGTLRSSQTPRWTLTSKTDIIRLNQRIPFHFNLYWFFYVTAVFINVNIKELKLFQMLIIFTGKNVAF